jgi:hypothetical protein
MELVWLLLMLLLLLLALELFGVSESETGRGEWETVKEKEDGDGATRVVKELRSGVKESKALSAEFIPDSSLLSERVDRESDEAKGEEEEGTDNIEGPSQSETESVRRFLPPSEANCEAE